MLRSTTPRKVNFADDVDSKNCTTCSALFTIVCLKHACKKCNKNYCGKCSKSNVTTISNTLVRERLCNGCSEQKSAVKSLFTPSKLNLLDEYGNAASKLWSADSDSDCDSEDDGTPRNTGIVGYRLSGDITEQENNEMVNKPTTSPPKDVGNVAKLNVTVLPAVGTTPAQDKLIRTLCDTSFSDTLSATSSVSSKAASSARKSPGGAGSCVACNVSFNAVVRRHMCSHCTKMVCGDCSTTELLIRNENVLRHRVCTSCQPALTDAPFTPGKLHLLCQPEGTGSATSGRRQLQNRLWSADTETDSDCSSQEISVDSIAENLLDAIDEEEVEEEFSGEPVPVEVEHLEPDAEAVEMFNEEADTSVFENWEVSWAPDFPGEAVNERHDTPERASAVCEKKSTSLLSSAHRSVAFAVLVTLYVLIFSVLYDPVKSFVLSTERAEPVAPLVPAAQFPLHVLNTPPPLQDDFQPTDENKATNRAAVATHAVPAVLCHRPETKVTMLLLAPPALSTTRLSAQSRKSKVSKSPEVVVKAESKALMRGGMGHFQAKIRAALHKCWRGVTGWFRANIFSRILPPHKRGSAV